MRLIILFICVLAVALLEARGTSNQTSRKVSSLNNKCSALFDKSDRVRRLRLRQVFRHLKIHRNCTVADVGAGTGWLTVRLATFVGPHGKVYAVEVVPHYMSSIKTEVSTYKLNNVQTILGSASDPNLPENVLDAVLILIAYHEFEKPIAMLTKIRKAMKDGARLGILDRDNDQMRAEAREAYAKTGYISHRLNETMINDFLAREHYLALDIVVREATSVGFRFLFSRELGDDHYVAIFAKTQ